MSGKHFFVCWFIIFFVGTALVWGCVVFIDAPLAHWAHDHQLRQYKFFHELQRIADFLMLLTPVVLLVAGWRRYRRYRLTLLDQMVWQSAIGVVCVSLMKYPLKFAFGRTWPATFYQNNPSLLNDNVYQFYPFHGGIAYSAFPSGHAAVSAVVAAILWHFAPRCRWLAFGVWGSVTLGLLGAYYHFLGDIIGGTLLGLFTAALLVRFEVRIWRNQTNEPCSP